MDINRKNYEIYAIDFVEGNLSTVDAAEFLAFLSENPDIANEVELLRDSPIKLPTNSNSEDFSFLKKNLNNLTITDKNFDEMCIAFHEGDLNTESGKKLLSAIEQDAELKARFELFGGLKLIPNKSVVFPNKSRLKQRRLHFVPGRRIIVGASSIAASVALFLLLNKTNNQVSFIDTLGDAIASIEIPIEEQEVKPQTATLETPKAIKKKSKFKKIVVEDVITHEEALAVVDTAEPEEERFIRITRIEPTPIQNNNLVAELSIPTTSTTPTKSSKSKIPDETIIDDFRQKGNQLFTKASNLTLTEIIQTGIKGINQMAETDLKYETTTNKNGKVTEFALSSETFNIRKKTKNN